MCRHGGVVVDMKEYQTSVQGSYPARGDYDLLFSVNMVNLSSRRMDGGGLEQKVLFSRMPTAKS